MSGSIHRKHACAYTTLIFSPICASAFDLCCTAGDSPAARIRGQLHPIYQNKHPSDASPAKGHNLLEHPFLWSPKSDLGKTPLWLLLYFLFIPHVLHNIYSLILHLALTLITTNNWSNLLVHLVTLARFIFFKRLVVEVMTGFFSVYNSNPKVHISRTNAIYKQPCDIFLYLIMHNQWNKK